jgi:tetratricopeptide (TPR) repeat protein
VQRYIFESKMPNTFFKKLTLFIFFVALVPNASFASTDQESLQSADSLFLAKRYTESMQIYEQLYFEKDIASPAMLLKMAYIKEGLEEYADALYFLEKYYLLSPKREVLIKIEELATKQNLRGFENTDSQYFKRLFAEYHFHIGLVFFSTCFLFLALINYRKRKEKFIPKPLVFSSLVFLILSFLFMNGFGIKDSAIIMEEGALLMKGPSSGADLIEKTNRGHKLVIIGKTDVWYRAMWKDEVVYIRENQIRKI